MFKYLVLCLLAAGVIPGRPVQAGEDEKAGLGLVRQQVAQGDLVAAQETIGKILAQEPDNKRAYKYQQLVEIKLRAKESLAQEAALDATGIKPNTVAVVSFANTGSKKDLDPLQKGLAEMLITDLAQVERLTLIERVQMQALATEMALGMTGLLEEKTCGRMGRLLGAARVVNGSFKSDDGATITLSAGIADAVKGGLPAAANVSGKLTDLFTLEKDLVFSIIDKLGVVLTDDERTQIQVIPTENILAYLAYSKGLDAEDRGDFDAAAGHYAEAAKLDPGFTKARDRAGQLVTAPATEPDLAQPTEPASMTEEVYVTQKQSEAAEAPVAQPVTQTKQAVTSTKISSSTYLAGCVTDLTSGNFMPEISVSDNVSKSASDTKEGSVSDKVDAAAGSAGPGVTPNSFFTSNNIGGATKEVSFEIPIPDIP